MALLTLSRSSVGLPGRNLLLTLPALLLVVFFFLFRTEKDFDPDAPDTPESAHDPG